MDPGISALIVLAILAASAIVFTVVFVIVADRELAKTEPEREERDEEERGEREESNGRMEREENKDSDGRRGE